MSVHDAIPGDVYVDSTGKIWRCVGVCREPTVTFEEVEDRVQTVSQHFVATIPANRGDRDIVRTRQCGGVGGLMWNGWKRIWRKEGA